ncbi:MAG: bifunctional diaminohydroxyphosphoribosylaminopyrimidine deaminase/5-amino-6-(5-phosphoribosylamino)uracil reductase RibD [Candidatus Diapherotrites archaeon]
MTEELMEKAIILAQKGKGKVKARPFVGCIIVKDGRIIATGFHGEKGRKHAEAIALEKAGKNAKNADLYCSLEPCSCKGFTGPCTKKIIKAGISRVFIGALDANPKNREKGIKRLQKAGIGVQAGILESEALRLNDYFNKWIKTKKPFVVLKSALTRDGFISWGNGKRKKISGKKADKYVQDYRAECDCILVGIGTVLKDNPRLSCRKPGSRNPVRVILDPKLQIPLNARLLKEKGKTMVFHSSKANPKKRKALEKKGVQCISVKAKKEKLDLKQVLAILGKKNYMSVLVEGGQKINTSFLEEKLADKIVLIFSRKEVGRGLEFCHDSLSKKLRIKKGSMRQLGGDLLVEGYL